MEKMHIFLEREIGSAFENSCVSNKKSFLYHTSSVAFIVSKGKSDLFIVR